MDEPNQFKLSFTIIWIEKVFKLIKIKKVLQEIVNN